MQSNDRRHISAALREIFPALTDTELKAAEVNLRRYYEIVDAMRNEMSLVSADFDKSSNPTTMKERSNGSLKI